jgi:dipeptidyl aminopeptidase/acylaminoacyl peptidase
VSISLPPRPPELGDPVLVDQEALIEEARRRARRRRLRNLVGVLAAMLGALWLYSLLGGGGPQDGAAFQTESSPPSAAHLKAALPEELSFDANGGIVLVHRDGTRQPLARGTLRQLDGGRWLIHYYGGAAWSPEGSKLLAKRWGSWGGFVQIDADGHIQPTVGGLAAHWSPDGSRIAFVRREPGVVGRDELVVASSDGLQMRQVASNLKPGSYSWSPTGTRLVYVERSDSRFLIVDASGRRAVRPITMTAGGAGLRDVTDVQWSPDGSLIAFTTYLSGGVYVVRPDGTSLRKVADGYDFTWSPIGTRLAVVGPAGGATWAHIAVVRSDGSGLHIIAGCPCGLRGPGFSQSVAWSPDGSRIAYVSGRGNTVSTIRPDGSGATVVATQAARGLNGTWYPRLPMWRPRTTR